MGVSNKQGQSKLKKKSNSSLNPNSNIGKLTMSQCNNQLLNDLEVPQTSPFGSNNKSMNTMKSTNPTSRDYNSISSKRDLSSAFMNSSNDFYNNNSVFSPEIHTNENTISNSQRHRSNNRNSIIDLCNSDDKNLNLNLAKNNTDHLYCSSVYKNVQQKKVNNIEDMNINVNLNFNSKKTNSNSNESCIKEEKKKKVKEQFEDWILSSFGDNNFDNLDMRTLSQMIYSI